MPPASASLYRRHRPRTFADVVGQEHVVRTLFNAIERGKVHHAYLFVGSRGTGKTSMAKILAASLNCVNGPTTEPCGTCDSCVAIASASSLDVIEMDAASNNSVDDIRDLREKVAYAPVSGRHKVYILDEAHMLSTAAWNAFLKTLEEPPPHTIFVLATTEAAKVLPTVVDRCHRFDFGRPTVAQITEVLRRVADAESIEIPDAACALIARSATGSFRDALGTLEQLHAYSGQAILLEDVLAVLGAADADLLFGTVDAVAAGDARAGLIAAARLAESGRDVGRFFGDLEAHTRALMVVQTLGGEVPPELAVTPEQDERLSEQAARVNATDVVRLLDLIAAGLRAMKDGSDARTQLELALVKAAVPRHEASTKALLTRLERVEARLGGSGVSPVAAPASRAPSVPATAAGRASSTRAPAVATAPPRPGPPANGPEQAEGQADPAVTAVAVVEPKDLDLASVAELWPAVVETAEADNRLVGAVLAHAKPTALEGDELRLALAGKTNKALAEDPAKRDLIAKAVRTVTGSSLRLAYELRADAELDVPDAPELSEEELIERFVTEFEAEELPPEPESQETP
ncbi:MAG TPA: DNA polymerase III subunit gamma/tau [Solirubrobacteraceae bacterium]|nr:DNA polymerase III subunit gamma/tau [Solirubrobacteraceae bacterium]